MIGPRWARLILLGLLVPVVGGKWGSYLGVGSSDIFLSDSLLVLGLGTLFLLRTTGARTASDLFLSTSQVLVTLAAALLTVYEFVTGNGTLLTRLRDLAPFMYLLLLPAVVWAVRALPKATLERMLNRALSLHALWSVPALLNVLPSFSLPALSLFPIFAPRPDIDVPLLGAFVVYTLPRAIKSRALRWLIATASVGAALEQTSRAALAATLIGVGAYALLQEHNKLRGAIRVTILSALAMLLAAIVIGAGGGSAVSRGALARAGLLPSDSLAAASGQGTAEGRLEAWHLMLAYWRDAGSPVLGVGPGTEMVADSGAVQFLSGDLAVRSPHDWWIGCLVRYGPIGLMVWLLMLLSSLSYRRLPETELRPVDRPLSACGALLIISILLAASLGVVIEAPFGSQILVLALAIYVTASPRRFPSRMSVDPASSLVHT